MTTCDSPWIAVGVAGMFLVGMTGAPSFLLARRARVVAPRVMLLGGAAFALVGFAATFAVTRGQGIAQLLPFAFLPALLGCSYAAVRPDPERLRAATWASGFSLAVLTVLVAGFAVDAAIGPQCPGVDVEGVPEPT